MADTTQSGVIPLVQGLMKQFPKAPAITMLNLTENLKKAGSDQNAIATAVNQFVGQMTQQPAAAAPVVAPEEPALDPVTISAPREVDLNKYGLGTTQPLNTDLASPYEGTTQEAANPANPGASGMSQFDPTQLKAAQAAQAQKYQDTLANRAITGGIAGAAAGFTDGRSVDQNAARWKIQDEQNMLETLGAQKALQEQATAGTENATKMQTMAKTAGEYQGTQQAKQQAIDTSALDLKQKAMLTTPGTRQAKMAELLAIKNAKDTGRELPADFAGKYSVADMASLGLLPKDVIQNFIDVATGRKATNEADVGEAVRNSLVNPIKVGPDGRATFDPAAVAKDPAKFREALVNAKLPAVVAQFDKQYPDIAPKEPLTLSPEGQDRMKYATISTPSASLPPTPQTMAEATAGAAKKIAVGDSVENWNVFGKPVVSRVREMLNNGAYTGPGGMITGAIPGASEQQQLLTYLAKLNDINPTLFPPQISSALATKGGTGYNGQFLASMSKETLNKLLDDYEGAMNTQIKNRVNRTTAEKSGVTPSEYPLTPEAGGVSTDKPSPKVGGLPIVTSQAQYDTLAPNTKYQDKNGKTYTKGSK